MNSHGVYLIWRRAFDHGGLHTNAVYASASAAQDVVDELNKVEQALVANGNYPTPRQVFSVMHAVLLGDLADLEVLQ
jgi:hypothetical protein